MKTIGILTMASIFALGTTAYAADKTLISTKTGSPIVLDGLADKAWDAAKAITVTVDELPYEPSNGYPGMKKTDVSIKSLYDDKNVYYLITYKDPTKSLARFPWVKQADGSWKKLAQKDDTGHDNTYYEDKLAMFWNINTKGFEAEGCMVACHLNEPGDTSPGRKYTETAGETIDMWHAKYVRTMPMGMFDDQYVDNTTDPKANEGWGRKGDTGKGGILLGGIFFLGSLAGPLLTGAARKSLAGKSSVFKSVGSAVGSLLGMGKGKEGRNTEKDTPSQAHLPDLDITYHTPLTADELRRGKTIQVLVYGEKGEQTLKVSIPPGSKDGRKLRIRGKGRPSPQGRGDLYLHLVEKQA